MAHSSFLALVLLGILLLVSPSIQRGNLYVNTIYSSATDEVLIDSLEGGFASVTNVNADTVSFGGFSSVAINAQQINLQGSFGLIEGTGSVNLVSSTNNAVLTAANNLDLNGNTINILSNGQSITFNSNNGEINFISGSEFTSNSLGFNVQTDVGGALFNSQGGDVSVNSAGNLNLNSNDQLNIDSTYDIQISTPADFTVTASAGEVALNTINEISFSAQNSLQLSSNGQLVAFNAGDYILINSDSFTASGTNALTVKSFTGGILVNGYDSTVFTSNGDLTFEGDNQGISVFSNGANTGIIQVTSSSNSIYFTAEGKGGEITGILANVNSVNASISRSVNVNAATDGVIKANGNINLSASGAIIIDTENVNIAASSVVASSTTGLSLNANNINLYAFDDATSGNTLGSTDITANNVQYTADGTIVIHGGDSLFKAGLGDLTVAGNNIAVYALTGDNQQHAITVTGFEFSLFTFGDTKITGGAIEIQAANQNIYAGGDYVVQLVPANAANSIQNLASNSINFNAPFGSFAHTSNSLLFDSFGSGTGGIFFTSTSTSTFETNLNNGIDFLTLGSFNTLASNVLYGYPNTNFDVTNQFVASGNQIEVTASSLFLDTYSLYFDSQDSNPATINQDIDFSAGQYLVITTARNEATNDLLSIDFATLNFNQQNIYFTGVEEGTFNLGALTVLSNQITLSSDSRQNINFYISSLFENATNNLEFTGNSVSFASPAGQTTLNAVDTVLLQIFNRGLLIDSLGSFLLTTTTTSDIFTTNDIVIDGQSDVAFNALSSSFSVTANSWIDILSTNASLQLSSTAGPFTVNSGNNIFFNTGNYQGDTFSTTSAGVFITDSNDFSTSVSQGNLNINTVANATITSPNITFEATGPINVNTGIFTFTTDTLQGQGGDISLTSTYDYVIFNAVNNFLINSTTASLAAQVLNHTTYEILFDSAENLYISTAAGGSISSTSDALDIIAYKPAPYGQYGDIELTGNNVNFGTQYLNQYMHFTSGGITNITAVGEIDFLSDGDYFILANNTAQFYAQTIYTYISESLTINATYNSCVNISHTGPTLYFQVSDAIPLFDNDLEFRATDFVYFQAGDGGVVLNAQGYTTKRQNQDGNTNGDLIFNEEISISVRSRNEEGNIVFEARYDIINFNAFQNIISISLEESLFYALAGQNYVSQNSLKIEAESGNVTMRGGHNYNLNANNLYFASTENTTSLSQDYTSIIVSGILDITANSGDIYFNTYYNKDININGQNVEFTAGAAGTEFIAEGSVTSKSNDFTVFGDRGINLYTNVGPILFDITGVTTLTSSQEFYARSGSNIVTTSVADTTFTGLGVLFTATSGDVLLISQTDAILQSKTALFQSLGTSTTTRDHVYFLSNIINVESLSMTVDASELVQIGVTTTPIVQLTASGDDATPGIIIDVSSAIEFTTNGQLELISVLGENDITGTSGVSFEAEGSVDITTDNFNIYSITGTTSLTAYDAITTTVKTTATIATDHLLIVSATNNGALDGITFDFETLVDSGTLLTTTLQSHYTVEADYVIYYSDQQGGVLEFQTLAGNININSIDELGFFSADTIDISSTSSTFNANLLTIQKFFSPDNAVTLQAQNNLQLVSSTAVSFTGDYIDVNAISASAPITLTSPAITFTSTSGSFISNSTQASTTIGVANNFVMNIQNYVKFAFSSLDSFTIGNDWDVITPVGSIAAQTIELTANGGIFTAAAFNDLTFNAYASIQITPGTAPLTLTLTTTLQSIYLTTTNDNSGILMSVFGNFEITAYSINMRAGTVDERESLTLSTDSLTVSGIQTSFIAEPTSIRVATPVQALFTTSIILNSNFISYNASSSESGFGSAIFASQSAPINFQTTNNHVFLSENARVRVESDSVINFLATTLDIATNGLDAVVLFENAASTTLTTKSTNLFSKTITRIASEQGTLTAFGSTISVLASGPNDGQGLGIELRGTYSNTFTATLGAITVGVAEGAVRYDALTDISIGATTTAVYTGSTFLIEAAGGRESPIVYNPGDFYTAYFPAQQSFVGIHVTDASTINIVATDKVTFQAELIYVPATTFVVDVNANNPIQFTTNEDFQIFTPQGTTSFGVNQFTLETRKGITLDSTVGPITVTSTSTAQSNTNPSFAMRAGRDAIDSDIIFYGTNGGALSVTATNALDINTNQHLLVEASAPIIISSTGVTSFRASRGDIMLRSVSSTTSLVLSEDGTYSGQTNLYDLTVTSGANINIKIGRSIRHREHWGLGFFDLPQQQGRAGPYTSSYPQVNNAGVYNAGTDCGCNNNAGPDCSCPDARDRIIQMYRAFVNYGLIQYDTFPYTFQTLF